MKIDTPEYEGADRQHYEPFGMRHLGAFATIFVSVIGGLFFTWNALTNQIAASDAKKDQQIDTLTQQVQSLTQAQQATSSLALTAATLGTRVDRDERDISSLQSGLSAQTQALVAATQQLTTVNDKLDFLTKGKGGRR